jgi:hypothetical protein
MCSKELKSFLNNYFGVEKDSGLDHCKRQWSHRLYRDTECGAWIDLTSLSKDTVCLGSIVEGSEAETEIQVLVWPFTAEDLSEAIEAVEEAVNEIIAFEAAEE